MLLFKNTETVDKVQEIIVHIMVVWLAFLLHIWELPASNLGPQADFWQFFNDLYQYLQADSGMEP
jgi:hypothetical protein